MLSVDALAVSVEHAPPYLGDGMMPTRAEDLAGLLREWSGDPAAEHKAEYLISVSTHAGIPLERLRMLTPREDAVEAAELALAALGPPPTPQPLLLVQSGPDRDNSTMLLPRLVHELDWDVTEVLGVTHLGSAGGTAILELLTWWVDPPIGATVLVVDQPVFVDADRVPDQLLAVALRFHGDGPLRVLDWGEGSAAPAAEHRFTGANACGGWPDLHAALGSDRVRPGDRIVVSSGDLDRQAWCLLQRHTPSDSPPAWWRPPVRVSEVARRRP